MAVFRVVIEPHFRDVEKVSVDPHPVLRTKAHVGFCRVRGGSYTYGWIMPHQHRLKPSHLELAEELLCDQLRRRAESQNPVSQRQEADPC